MKFIADLHIHSPYSRSTSSRMTIENLWRWAQLKGITVLGTGDFTHPVWFRELQQKLAPAEDGLYALRERPGGGEFVVPASCGGEVRFMLSAEVSCIYSKNGKTRKVHNVILCPDFESARKINLRLERIGNLCSDGRPILGLDSRNLLEIVLESSEKNILIPAHIWTPHFSVLGAFSAFSSIEECFEELAEHIPAVETGLSSDPPMNWRVKSLDSYTLVSNSDAHSPAKLAREANIFDTGLSYFLIKKALEDPAQGFLGTIEFFPEEGKYHYDGHRACGVRTSPAETAAFGGKCPKCGKKLTLGVLYRVEELADKDTAGCAVSITPPFHSLVPLMEIIAEMLGVGVESKKVQVKYFGILERLGNELHVLLNAPIEQIEAECGEEIAGAVRNMRNKDIKVEPGYDGEYGRIKLFPQKKREELKTRAQITLF